MWVGYQRGCQHHKESRATPSLLLPADEMSGKWVHVGLGETLSSCGFLAMTRRKQLAAMGGPRETPTAQLLQWSVWIQGGSPPTLPHPHTS
jgi:hypothetical protein